MKKTILIVSILVFGGINANAQNSYSSLIAKADSLYKIKDYGSSFKIYDEAFKIEVKNKIDLYNAACVAALLGDHKNAFKFLNLSIDKGWIDLVQLKKDADLVSLHNMKKWESIISKTEINVDKIEASYNKPVKAALEEVYKTDQGIRLDYIAAQKEYGSKNAKVDSLGKLMMYHDSLNTKIVTGILDKYGWLGEDKVGNKGNLTLF